MSCAIERGDFPAWTGKVAAQPKPIPADTIRHPSGCPDPDWCVGNRVCYWDCRGEFGGIPEEDGEP